MKTKENSRFNFKEKTKNAILFDANAEEIEFPELEPGEDPSEGDEILINDKKLTGQIVMPNGSTIIFENGIITEIIKSEKTKNSQNKNVCRTLKDSLNRKIEIIGTDPEKAFMVGNQILMDGREVTLAKCKVGNIEITIIRGKITNIKACNSH